MSQEHVELVELVQVVQESGGETSVIGSECEVE